MSKTIKEQRKSLVTYGLLDAILHVLDEEQLPYKIDTSDLFYPYHYDPRLMELLGDFRVMVNFEELENFQEESLNSYGPLEIETFICRLVRGERFCSGKLAGAIRSGRLELLCKRMMNFF